MIREFPFNVSIIMDGNGRWAQRRRRPRFWGHLRGASVVSEIVEKAVDLKVRSLTLYAFSTENWSRPEAEVLFLFKLLDKFIIKEKANIIKNNIQFDIIGEYDFLSDSTKKKIESLKCETNTNTGLKLNFAFGYGGRQEILRSVNQFISTNPGKEITENNLSQNLYNPSVSDVDLLIRTGGEKRLSNFLLWQLSYAELHFSNTLWPEFNSDEFASILNEISKRERRFGRVSNQSFISESNEHIKYNKAKLETEARNLRL